MSNYLRCETLWNLSTHLGLLSFVDSFQYSSYEGTCYGINHMGSQIVLPGMYGNLVAVLGARVTKKSIGWIYVAFNSSASHWLWLLRADLGSGMDLLAQVHDE